MQIEHVRGHVQNSILQYCYIEAKVIRQSLCSSNIFHWVLLSGLTGLETH